MTTVFTWLEDKSDWLSPIVVKEVRQIVRSRDFILSFSASLIAALAVAFYGTAIALTGSGTAGSPTFVGLMVCLMFLGLLVVPASAFTALRTERLEQTLELVTVTALSPRRVVIGKLMAQAVKLVTIFAAMAPFVAMTFLLGGIDFVTILLSLLGLFVCSLWASAAFLFLSTLFKSRAMSGAVFGVAGIGIFFFVVISRVPMMMGPRAFGFGPGSRTAFWWALAMFLSGCVMMTINFVLLAENRLGVATENRVTALRAGFLAQFALIAGWALTYIRQPAATRDGVAYVFGTFAGLHLALVAMFAITDDLVVPRRVLLQMRRPSRWSVLPALFRPGGGRGAAYVLVQVALVMAVGAVLGATPSTLRWLAAMCGYICLFAGVPALAWRLAKPESDAALRLRVTVLLLVVAALILPDLLYYAVSGADTFSLSFGRRHLINPFRTLASWREVKAAHWEIVPAGFGFAGVVACARLVWLGAHVTDKQDAATAR